jgi:hypothetical protein
VTEKTAFCSPERRLYVFLPDMAGSARKTAKPVAEAAFPLDDDKQISDF